MSTIAGNMIGSYSQLGKTFILTDESGNEYTGVVTDKEVIFDATDNDVRENVVYASDGGVSIGTKVIPSYHTYHGARIIAAGRQFSVQLQDMDAYDYTVLHGMICTYNTTLLNSTSVEKIVLYDEVFPVQSTEAIASVTKDAETQSIVLGITNDTTKPQIFRYITYKEIY